MIIKCPWSGRPLLIFRGREQSNLARLGAQVPDQNGGSGTALDHLCCRQLSAGHQRVKTGDIFGASWLWSDSQSVFIMVSKTWASVPWIEVSEFLAPFLSPVKNGSRDWLPASGCFTSLMESSKGGGHVSSLQGLGILTIQWPMCDVTVRPPSCLSIRSSLSLFFWSRAQLATS